MFEMSLDTHLCYFRRRKSTTMNVKPKFKSWKSSIDIWEAIVLGLRSLVPFLQKKGYMNLNIYMSQILERLRLPFYN